ncbi:hypothetical protein IFR05_015620 [Cadophora sp. M221]|nr:hypothetical protein IFR05_015620 [Cadophora sp. M221]
MPETLRKAPEHKNQASALEATGLSAYFKFLKDWRIFVGIVTVFLAQFATTLSKFCSRTLLAFLVIGAAVLAAAPNISIVVVALIIYATGFETAQLYTLVATTDAVAHMIASPLLQKVWGGALELGGRWIVLPFLVLMGVFSLAFLASRLLTEPTKVDEDPLLSEGDNENNFEESHVFTE